MKRGQGFFILFFILLFIITSFLQKAFAREFSNRQDYHERFRDRFNVVRPNPSPLPSTSPEPTRTPRPFPSVKPFPTPSPFIFRFRLPFASPSPTPNTKLDFMMNQINDYRRSMGKSTLSTDPYTCNYANKRAREIASNFSHIGFNTNSLPYPSYSRVVENISMSSDYKEVVPMWIGSSAHATNLQAEITYACVGWHNDYYAFEGWLP